MAHLKKADAYRIEAEARLAEARAILSYISFLGWDAFLDLAGEMIEEGVVTFERADRRMELEISAERIMIAYNIALMGGMDVETLTTFYDGQPSIEIDEGYESRYD